MVKYRRVTSGRAESRLLHCRVSLPFGYLTFVRAYSDYCRRCTGCFKADSLERFTRRSECLATPWIFRVSLSSRKFLRRN